MTGQIEAPSLHQIEQLAQAAIERLPPAFRARLGDVVLRTVDFPDEETLADQGLDSPFDLLGFYDGVPVGAGDGGQGGPSLIFLYRRPILDYWIESGETLGAVVTHVIVHEIGHHFGLSDADMDRIEAGAR